MTTRYLSEHEAARYYRERGIPMEASTLRKRRMQRRPPRYLKIGGGRNGRIRYDVQDLDADIESCRVETVEED